MNERIPAIDPVIIPQKDWPSKPPGHIDHPENHPFYGESGSPTIVVRRKQQNESYDLGFIRDPLFWDKGPTLSQLRSEEQEQRGNKKIGITKKVVGFKPEESVGIEGKVKKPVRESTPKTWFRAFFHEPLIRSLLFQPEGGLTPKFYKEFGFKDDNELKKALKTLGREYSRIIRMINMGAIDAHDAPVDKEYEDLFLLGPEVEVSSMDDPTLSRNLKYVWINYKKLTRGLESGFHSSFFEAEEKDAIKELAHSLGIKIK